MGDYREYHQAGKTVLLTTHNTDEADALCQRLAIIDHGHVIALGTPVELKASIPGGFLLRLRFGNLTAVCSSVYNRWLESARCALRTARAPMSMRTAAVLSFPKLPPWLPMQARNCQTFTFLSRV